MFTMKTTFRTTFLALACFAMTAPAIAVNFDQKSSSSRRSQKQDEWKKIGIASAAASLLGLLTKNGTVTTLGAAGALYSAYRYEEDRKSSKRQDRERARLYSKKYVTIDGHRYKRKTVKKQGKTYYQFVRI